MIDIKNITKCPACQELIVKAPGRVHCKNFPILCKFTALSTESSIDVNGLTIAVFDVETSGIGKADSIIQIAHRILKGGELITEFDSLIKPVRADGTVKTISQVITNITSITNDMLIDAPPTKEAMQRWHESITVDGNLPDMLIAHNASFDKRFLIGALKDSDIHVTLPPVVDTLRMARKVFPKGTLPNHKQGTLAEHFGISYEYKEGAQAHLADADVYVLSKLFYKLAAMLPEGDSVYNYVVK